MCMALVLRPEEEFEKVKRINSEKKRRSSKSIIE